MDLQNLVSRLEAVTTTTSTGPRLESLTNEQLLEEHAKAVDVKRNEGDIHRAQKAANTNRVKQIEKLLTERAVDFEPMPEANRAPALDSLSDEQLVEEFDRLIAEREDADGTLGAGRKSAITRRAKDIITVLKERADNQPEAEQPTEPEQPAEAEAAPTRRRQRAAA